MIYLVDSGEEGRLMRSYGNNVILKRLVDNHAATNTEKKDPKYSLYIHS